MNTPLPGPGRRTPAGPGLPSEERSREADHAASIVSDMERALGALRDFTRRDILLRFYTDRKARSVDDVAKEAGVHRSVAFDHLERLVALGYLEVARRRGLPGKPAKLYRLTAGPVQISHPMRRYDVLAEALARSVAQSSGGEEAIRDAGRALGRSLGRPHPSSMNAALEPMVELGAEYEVEQDDSIVCLNCLFAEVCRRVPEICEFHAGVIEGLSGEGVTVESLGFRGPGGCAYVINGRL